MKYKTFLLLVLMLIPLTMRVQAKPTPLEGMWLQVGQDDVPTLYGKVFLPDGRLYGFCFSKDFKNTATWIMADYKVVDDSVYQEHVFFHSDINYQRDISFNYFKENDSILITSYTNYYPNGQKMLITERWKKVKDSLDKWTNDAWKSEYQKALTDFGRVPREGQSIADKGKELCDTYQRYYDRQQMDQANEALLIRAELDTMNLEWQNDVLAFYQNINVTPSIAEKISNRAIRLSKSVAKSPTDTTIVNAYFLQGMIFMKRGPNGFADAKRSLQKVIGLEKASNRPAKKSTGLVYYTMAMLNGENPEAMYEYASQCATILDAAPDADNQQKGEGHYLVALALKGLKEFEKSNKELELVIPLFLNDKGEPLPKLAEIHLIMFLNFMDLLKQGTLSKNTYKDFLKFMEDKMLCLEITDPLNKWQLKGDYYIMEVNNWDMDHLTTAMKGKESARHIKLQKDGKFYSIDLEENQEIDANLRMVTSDHEWKQQLLKQWRKNKKGK